MTAAPADAPMKFVLKAEPYRKRRKFVDGEAEWVRHKGLKLGEPAPETGRTGLYAEVSALAVALNESQKALGRWAWLYWPDVADAPPVKLESIAKELSV
ncbi:hypothetical protein ACFWGP_05620 [Agromyces sp. NPDC127015]|uniref:hypothetical protein n=1 Tax=Agromyces sp. NPDC127015 TaxID=3347108 RepID=UPI003645FABB